ncbi:MAG: PBP1A family penicillin-binding protein [Desulfobacteraceae bacterium]|nr:PBP1A family penicillin-binding protein [Desulfobacteraceae bacterium]
MLGLAIAVGLWGYFYYLYAEVKNRFESRKWSIPSRVFSATVPVYPGQSLTVTQLRQMLEERRYLEAAREPLRSGEYKINKNSMVVHFREFHFPGHTLPSQRVQFEFQQNKLTRIRCPFGDAPFLELESLEIARLFGQSRESRLLVNIQQVPKHLVDGIVAIEDHRYFEHGGIDWWGISRALWTDLRAGRVVQGGSTITQQLVKNYFLEPQRNLKRKLLEASMSVIIEAMYSKDEILEMYMNEIYLGQRGSVAIHGVGEAARYYFGRNVEDLTFPEAATLAGMIQAPNGYSPLTRTDAALERRNVVLKRMLDLGKISQQDYDKARGEPIKIPILASSGNVAPYFVDYVRLQLQELYSPQTLGSEGLNIYTTLHPEIALAADAAVREGLEELGREYAQREGNQGGEPLQAVLIAVQPKTGAVLAMVGGRDYSESNFNRALFAHRQPGSALKPFVYLSALDEFTPSSWLADEEETYSVDGASWTPRNHDGRYRGKVSFRTGLEDSLNAATVRLSLNVGLEKVISTMRGVGIQSMLQPVPSLGLGVFEVTPIELAGAYATLDNDGQKPYLLSLKEVVAENGEIQERRNTDFVSVTSPAKAYIVTNLLEGAIERGTGKSVKRMGIDFPCAGKTGTTNDFHDSWFAGYTTDLLVLVWVGFDDNRPTGFSGAQGAGRIWARFMNSVRPFIHPQQFRMPPGVVQRILCKESGQLAVLRCRDRILEVFRSDNVPKDYCTIHSKQ